MEKDTFGTSIIEAKNNKGYTQKEWLANLLYVDITTVSKWE